MNNKNQQRPGGHRHVVSNLMRGAAMAGRPLAVAGLFASLVASQIGLVHAAGEVISIQTSDQTATPSRYTIDGVTYTWGMGTNQVMESFTVDSTQYDFATMADRVELIRHDDKRSTGNPCGVFVERLTAASNTVLKANYPSDGSDTGNCDMAAMLRSRVVNRGALDLFSNAGPNPKNVERVDYLFDRGLLAPVSVKALSRSGHVVAEKSGNNPLQIAAITAVDILGQPTQYGPLVYVHGHGCADDQICYGFSNIHHNYSFFQNNSHAPQGYPSYLRDSSESVGMAFISLDKLGLSAGQIYYGFSYFANDVREGEHTLTDVASFPKDTQDEDIVIGDGADIYGGVSGYFLAKSLSVVTGAVFKDENHDGLVNENEAGISDIKLTLYTDSNSNGVFDPDEDQQLGESINSDISGEFVIPGLDDGIYFLLLDEADADLPPGISVVPGTNPVMIVINGDDADGVNFAFVNDAETGADGGGTDSGGSDAGSDAGGSDAGADAGGSDAGSDAGVSDAGSDAGGSDAGSDAGSSDAGSDAGGSDAGSDAGSSDAGLDAGGSDAGADAGGSDAGADAGDSDAGADAGDSDAGADAGDSDAGADAGDSDAGADAGDSDAGADAGDSDAGADAGDSDAGSDAGGSDAGSDAGVSDAGSDAGVSDAGSDAGVSDAGSDAGDSDAGSDAGESDAGESDAGNGTGGADSGETDAGTGGGDSGETDSGPDDGFVNIEDGVNETVANPDNAIVFQGFTQSIDVLANDADSPGQGLTLISTTESPNAEIQIENNQVTYKPNFGYLGVDNFLYVMEDSAGNQSTSTVTVEVKRYSDINDNGENDFDECMCDNLTIEVGVDGSALGGSSLFSFLMLTFLYGFRNLSRTKRKTNGGVA